MFRIIRTTTLAALHADRDEADHAAQIYSDESEKWHQAYVEEADRADVAEAAAEALRGDLETQFSGLQAVIKQTSKERDAAREEVDAARAQILLDAEDRVALRALLRTARRQAARAARVYVLFRHGVLHSVHASMEAAEAAAEAEGAPREGWTSHTPGAALPAASEVTWRVQALPLGGVL
ncbi:hypothetical protein [Streptomyces sp. GSL17-111]|uniref:hypothetical protein n=1 Tax=Streptomyces sp. GSL17-111 TaxID=3121596 RepID=UPI0030F47F5D